MAQVKMKPKQAFWKIVLAYFLVPAVFIIFNLLVDPYGRYQPVASKQTLKKLAASSSEVLVTEYNYNDRLLVKNYVTAVPKPDLIILGGSRILNINTGVFSPEAGRVLNLGVTAASVRDHIAVWQTLKSKKKIPARVLLFVDLQTFYSTPSSIGWWTLSCPFLSFEYGRMKTSKYLKLVSKTYRKKTSFHLESLSSSDLLNKSWKRLTKENKTRSRLIERGALDPKNAARTPALALLAPAPSEEETRQELINKWAKENGQGEISYLRDWSSFSDQTFNEFASLLEDMRANSVGVSVIIMPAHPLSYLEAERNGAAFTNLLKFTVRVQEICGQHGAGYYDGLYDHHADVVDEDFKDGVHLKKEAAYSFLKRAALDLNLFFIKN